MNILNSANTAATINKIIHNAQGTTTTTEGATAAGKIIKENLPDIISAGFDMPHPTSIFEGVPPFSFISNGEPLVNWIIYGNTGGVGEKTDNLYDVSAVDPDNGYVAEKYLNSSGNEYIPSSASTALITEYIPVSAETTYSQDDFYTGNSGTPAICFYTSEKVFISGVSAKNTATFTTPENCAFVRISRTTTSETSMLNTGDTIKSFEPYGYKIPVTCGGVTTNIYIDEPLTIGETITYNETGVIIPTTMFLNTLSVDTTVQPEKVFIEYVK